MNPLTVAQFRSDFPEFESTAAYPDSLVAFWLAVVLVQFQNTLRWGPLLTQGQELALAHYVVIGTRDQQAAALGALPGQVQGIVNAQSVDVVSESYDTSAVTFGNQAFWNQTSYGLRLYQLIRLVGAGGIQIL